MGIEVRRLRQSDVVGGFRSGEPRLDGYLKRYAKENDAARRSATWLALEEGRVAGFLTVVPGSVRSALLTGTLPDLPGYPAPVLLLARMATDKRWKGRGVGTRLLRTTYEAALAQADAFGCVGVFVDAKPDAVAFYAKLGFATVEPPATPEASTGMFMPLREVESRLAAMGAAAP
ncbi:MAG: GNAT family N-acetyltransferase [Polyangiales bacterium]